MRWLIILSLLLVPLGGYGQEVSYKVLDHVTLPNGNIQTQVEYTLPDGKVVRNDYQSVYSNYENKTALESQAWLQAQINYQCDNYIKEYLKKENLLTTAQNTVSNKALEIRTPINNNIIQNKLSGMKGKTGSKNYLKYKITDKGNVAYEQLNEEKVDGTIVKEITIDMEGGTSEAIITP